MKAITPLKLIKNIWKHLSDKRKYHILITLFVLWIFLYFLFNEILASRITYRNFEILIGAISLNFLICFIKSLNLGKLKIII